MGRPKAGIQRGHRSSPGNFSEKSLHLAGRAEGDQDPAKGATGKCPDMGQIARGVQ